MEHFPFTYNLCSIVTIELHVQCGLCKFWPFLSWKTLQGYQKSKMTITDESTYTISYKCMFTKWFMNICVIWVSKTCTNSNFALSKKPSGWFNQINLLRRESMLQCQKKFRTVLEKYAICHMPQKDVKYPNITFLMIQP
jgi:hypothetical protein